MSVRVYFRGDVAAWLAVVRWRCRAWARSRTAEHVEHDLLYVETFLRLP